MSDRLVITLAKLIKKSVYYGYFKVEENAQQYELFSGEIWGISTKWRYE
jgi:hypothetical protein